MTQRSILHSMSKNDSQINPLRDNAGERSDSRPRMAKRAERGFSDVESQQKVLSSNATRDPSPFLRAGKKKYYLPKNFDVKSFALIGKRSPGKYINTKDLILNHIENHNSTTNPGYLHSKKSSETKEKLKLKNLEAFFAEKFRLISKKVNTKLKKNTETVHKSIHSTSSSTSKKPIKKNEMLSEYHNDPILESGIPNPSRMTKKMLQADNQIFSKIEEEIIIEKSKNEEETPKTIKFREKSSESVQLLVTKFTKLNQRAERFLKSLPSEASFSNLGLNALEEFYINSNMSSKRIIRLPAIKKSGFFDPSPLPPEFKVNRELLEANY
ncbi:hypothetical protein SteCoe_22352 [Stentor coeruleus]|uniref:Uncharacterized protein n=1 Tax=Stentor coeruleus TaxID=5963 RepID=A0A1R2BMK2_9CILI|nr:hypothetical protein SteCoe_22352 [Stentor coeruleus]